MVLAPVVQLSKFYLDCLLSGSRSRRKRLGRWVDCLGYSRRLMSRSRIKESGP